MSCTLFVILTGTLFLAADARDDAAARKELDRLQGTWTLVSGEKEGQKLAPEDVQKSKITWKGNQATVETPHQSKEPIKATITIVDAKGSPRVMEWVRSNGPDAGKKFIAIYEFMGDDQYRICFTTSDRERPKEFATKPGSGHFLHVWKRVK